MNKRIKNKKIKQKYTHGVNHLSWYCELPIDTIIKEVHDDLTIVVSDLFTSDEFHTDYTAYLDSVSIGLMQKYGTGWAGRG